MTLASRSHVPRPVELALTPQRSSGEVAVGGCPPCVPLSLTESFTAADGDLVSADQDWVEGPGNISPDDLLRVAGNAVTGNPGGVGTIVGETLARDQVISVEIVSASALTAGQGATVILIGRIERDPVEADDYYYFISRFIGGATGDYVIGKTYQANFTVEAADGAHATPTVAGDTMTLAIVGTSIAGKINGVTVLSIEDSDVTGLCGSSAGLAVSCDPARVLTVDNFTVDSVCFTP